MLPKQNIFTPEDHETWRKFLNIRLKNIENFACAEFLEGLQQIKFPVNRIPESHYITDKLHTRTGWKIQPITDTIKSKDFFHLLSQKIFPVATKIRPIQSLEFYEATEPDLIHDYFGHCPLLMDDRFTNFIYQFGQMAIKNPDENQIIIEKFYWFTVEFGLIKSINGLRILGSGILSSVAETAYVMESDLPKKEQFNIERILSQPLETNKNKSVYYILDDFNQLYEMLDYNWSKLLRGKN